jgi:phosphate acetyltransferase
MKTTFFLSPSSTDAGLTTVSLGLGRALQRRGVKVAFVKPIAQQHPNAKGGERSRAYAEAALGIRPAEPIPYAEAAEALHSGRAQDVMERVIAVFEASTREADVAVVEGLIVNEGDLASARLNQAIARALDARVLLVDAFSDGNAAELQTRLRVAASAYAAGGPSSKRVVGCILNKADPDQYGPTREAWAKGLEALRSEVPDFRDGVLQLVGCIPKSASLLSYRTLDVARHLNAGIMIEGDLKKRRVLAVKMVARTVANLYDTFTPGALLLTPADRDDVLMATSLAAIKGVPLAGLVLTGCDTIEPSPMVRDLCSPAADSGLPVLMAAGSSYRVINEIGNLTNEIPVDDLERLDATLEFIARHMDCSWLVEKGIESQFEVRLSPPAFRFRLAERARAANRRILLPEGDEPRTIAAAISCAQRGIARCVLIGDPEEIRAKAEGMEIQNGLEIIDPREIRHRYIAPLAEMRSHKGLTEAMAAELLEDNVYLATVMLALDEADGMVSGAVHSTASTIRPALQLIRTAPEAKVVSSVFFMCLPEQVLVYGDCAVNPNPDSETLADIAIRSAESAERFGITPRVAMISYSTGESAGGNEVEKVREATRLARLMRPDLLIDGPLQYDAAAIPEIARKKAPNSKVAGNATVFIFPDLNTGNTTYKAVQRSAKVVSVGPMLQGLRKPVNDLSRGALVDDIIYTIALTAVQADRQHVA